MLRLQVLDRHRRLPPLMRLGRTRVRHRHRRLGQACPGSRLDADAELALVRPAHDQVAPSLAGSHPVREAPGNGVLDQRLARLGEIFERGAADVGVREVRW